MNSRGAAMAGLVFAVLFWAINAVVAKGVVDHIPPIALSFYRWITAMAILFPFAVKGVVREKAAIRSHIRALFWIALPSVAVYNSCLYLAARFTTATNISLMAAAMPAVTLAAAWIIIGERPRPVQVAGITLAMGGVAAIVAQGNPAVLYRLEPNPGDLLMLVSIIAWSVYSIYYKKLALPLSPIPFLFSTMVLGALIILPFYLWEFSRNGGFAVNGTVCGLFLYLGLCPSVLSYIFWNHGVKVMGAATAMVSVYLTPVFTAAIAWVWLGEVLQIYHWIGGLLILVGLIFSSRQRG